MYKRIAIGLIVLFFVLGVAFVFYQQHTDIQALKEQLVARDEKNLEGNNKPMAAHDLPPADPGYKWVPHGDHFHQVPSDAPDVWQGGPHEKPASEEIVVAPLVLTSDLPDELPEKFPTEAELRQMSYPDLRHLVKLYKKESNKIGETDFDAGVRLYNATIPILYKIIDENLDKLAEYVEAVEKENRAKRPLPWSRPATEDLPAMSVDTKPPKRVSTEGGTR